MKRRILWFALGALLLVIGLLVVVRLPATQRVLLLHATAGVPGLDLQVRRVSAGFSAAELDGVDVRYEGRVVRFPHVKIVYSGWSLLVRRELVVNELVATDLELELAGGERGHGPTANGSGTAAEAFAGFLAPLRLPMRTTVDSVEIGGKVRIDASTTVNFSAQGRLLLPGQEARTDLQLEWRDTTTGAAAKELDWVGRLATTASADGMVQRIQITGTLAVPRRTTGAPEHGLATNLAVSDEGSNGVEAIEAVVRLSTAKETDTPLLKATMRHRRAADSLEGDWALQLRREQFEGMLDMNALPDFSALANGSFRVAAASGDFAAEGEATVTVPNLQRWRREFAALGTVSGKVGFAVERRGRELRLARLAVELGDGRGAGLKLEALQPVGYQTDTGTVDFQRPDTDLLRLAVSGLPLAWAKPWLGDTELGGTIGSGELRFKGAGSAWTVATAQPFAFTNVSFGCGKRTAIDRVSGELAVRATIDGAKWAVETLELKLRSGGGTPFDALTLALSGSGEAGRGSVRLPVTLESGGRRSDLSVAADWATTGDVRTGRARLQGDTVFVRDFGALAALAPSGAERPVPAKKVGGAKVKAAVPVADHEAFWAGMAGRVDVELGRVVLETEELRGVRAALVCDAQHLALEQLSAKTKNNALEAKCGVTFDGAKAAPYALEGSGAFPGFDLGAWLRAANTAEEPALETVVDVTAKVAGQGVNREDLIAGLRGDFVLKGGPGILRIKDKKVETASALGGLVLGLLSKEKQQKPAVAAGAQLIEELREFRFDQLEVSLLRGDDLNLQLRTIDIRSAEKRLSGTGVARHVAGRTIDEYPLELEMRLAGKGNFGALLEQASLLDGSKDELGYLRLRQPFTVTGKVGAPNWKKMLAQLGAGLLLGK